MKNKTFLPEEVELKQFEQEWFKLAEKYAHLLNNESHFHATYFKENKKELKRLDNSHHKATPKFKIMFKNGKTIPEQGFSMNGTQVLIAIIRYVGAKQVFDKGILTVGKRNVVSQDYNAIYNLSPNLVEDGWWVITKTPNPEKIKTINDIIKSFGLEAEIIEEIE